jgi:hypothetical protein
MKELPDVRIRQDSRYPSTLVFPPTMLGDSDGTSFRSQSNEMGDTQILRQLVRIYSRSMRIAAC